MKASKIDFESLYQTFKTKFENYSEEFRCIRRLYKTICQICDRTKICEWIRK